MSSAQVALRLPVHYSLTKKSIWLDSLMFPAYITLASITILLLQALNRLFIQKLRRRFSNNSNVAEQVENETDRVDSTDATGFFAEVKNHISQCGGTRNFVLLVIQLLACIASLSLSLVSLVIIESERETSHPGFGAYGKWGKNHRGRHKPYNLTQAEWLHGAMCMTHLYTSFLALITVCSTKRFTNVVSRHLRVLLLCTFAVYVYRDLVPLATYNLLPRDRYEGWAILGAKVGILGFVSTLVPLIMPRRYTPVEPEDPAPEPNPEQTASLLSLLLYNFLDPVIWFAYRVPHLSYDNLPPLADYDRARYMTRRARHELDPFHHGKGKRHIFFGLMRVFRTDYIILALMLIIYTFTSFAAPMGINRILNYLETNGTDTTLRPWFWVTWLLAGPMLGSVALQRYIFIATRILVRVECLLTQLVLEHSLRIRVKAETGDPPSITQQNDAALHSSTLDEPAQGSSTSSTHETLVPSEIGSNEETLTQDSASVRSTSTGSSQKQPSKPSKKKDDNEASADNLVGKINNLISTDLGNITEARDFLFVVLYIPLQIILCIVFLYMVLGWSAFVGLASMLLLFPIPGQVARMIQKVQILRMKKTDGRVQSVTEIMNVLRMVKLFGWEPKMIAKVKEKREEELKWIWKRQILDLINGHLNFCIPLITMIATYASYTLLQKESLNASKVFSSMAVFDMLRDQLHIVLYSVTQMVQGKVSLDRVNDFLHNTELLDEFAEKPATEQLLATMSTEENEKIGFKDASFSWTSEEEDGTLTPSRRRFKLRIENELLFPNSISLIVGPTGSGKTSLLMALLGEMHFTSRGPGSWFNLPRKGGVAYAAQESWVQNETIKENILFGAPYDEARYKKVIYQCALTRDLELFEAGDDTEVGEKGLTLSGGQKARITLARAIYSSANVLLLDDILAALDVHTAKWIVEKCLAGDLVKGRTVLLVTHNVALAASVANFAVYLNVDGTIARQGATQEVLADKRLTLDVQKDEELSKKAEEEITAPPATKADGKLTVVEEIAEGHVSWAALKMYFRGMAGNHALLFFTTYFGGILLSTLASVIQTWYLGQWAAEYDKPGAGVDEIYYLSMYAGLLGVAVIFYTIAFVIKTVGVVRASRELHNKLIASVLGTTLRWLDITPVSRVLTRCTQDIRSLDGPIPQGVGWLTEITAIMILKFIAVIIFTPIFALPGAFIAILGGWFGQIYMKAQLSVKREMSNAKAPVLGHFGAAIAGLTSIRAYGAQEAFKQESLRRIDRYTRAGRIFYNLNRWICIRVDLLGALFATGLASYLIYGQDTTSSADTGFSLNMAIGFSSLILWWVRCLNEFEVNGNSLERIEQYVTIEQEPKSTEQGKPPAAWPTSGDLRVEGLCARYSLDGPKVLRDLNFHIRSGERVGVVGRTGSGKSSLTLSLLRCIPTEGTIYYDGIPISSINLDELRRNITIIPQVPELLSGSLRQNLDPFEQYDDATLNAALRASGLFALQSEDDEDRITLDTAIASGGSNLSVGQRQIIALARAIVRGSKLLILDEATSAIDYKTDAIIQSSLRHELGGDVTLITVAHRLQTIMDADKILVLDAGKLVEFGSPIDLLQNEHGILRALVDESGDRENLIAMAERK